MGVKSILTTVVVTVALAAANPGVIEVDLIFPRNETYAPNSTLPLVFGFRDPNNASASLNNFGVSWSLLPFDRAAAFANSTEDDLDDCDIAEDPSHEDIRNSRQGMVSLPAGGQDAAQFVWVSLAGLADNVTDWYLHWAPMADCTGTIGNKKLNSQLAPVHFKIDKKAQSYSIVPSNCKDAQPYVLNVTAKSGDTNGPADPHCGYDHGPLPKADPCKGQISAEEAAKIVKAVVSKAETCSDQTSGRGCSENWNTNNSAASTMVTGSSVLVLACATIWVFTLA